MFEIGEKVCHSADEKIKYTVIGRSNKNDIGQYFYQIEDKNGNSYSQEYYPENYFNKIEKPKPILLKDFLSEE